MAHEAVNIEMGTRLARRTDDKWTKSLVEWRLRNALGPQKSKQRCLTVKSCGTRRMSLALNRLVCAD